MFKFLILFLTSSVLFAVPTTWTAPTTLSALGQNAFNPQVGLDTTGNAVAGWIQSGFFRSATKLVAGSWSAATTVSASGTTVMRLVVDPAGNATAIWLESGALKAATLPFGGAWSAATTLAASASAPQLSIDATGNAVAVWVSGGGAILSKTRPFLTGIWSLISDILAASGDTPQVAIGNNGTVVALWHGTVGSIDTIFASTKTIALGLWSLGAAISTANQNCIVPNIAVDTDGDAIALWFRNFPFTFPSGRTVTFSKVQSASLPVGGSWATPIDVSPMAIFHPQALITHIGFDSFGSAIAMWNLSQDGQTFTLAAATLPANGSNWDDPIYVLGSNLFGFAFDLAILSNGYAYTAYMALDSNNALNVQTAKIEMEAINSLSAYSFSTLSTGSVNGFPSIAASLTGSTVHTAAAWINFNGSNRIIHVATGTGAIVETPTSPSVMQNSVNNGLFTETFYTISWTASTTPTVANYLLFRNGRFLAKVDSFTLQYVDRNRSASQSVTYSIAALDSDGSQSGLVNVTFP